MSGREGVFAGDDPFDLLRRWMDEAKLSEINDPDAAALATVDESLLPNVRMVLLRIVGTNDVVFFTNYTSTKAKEIEGAGKAALALHWKSLRRQVRVRGPVAKESGELADDYFASRSLGSRLGAWASDQSSPLSSRQELEDRLAHVTETHGHTPPRPDFWGGYRLSPIEMEFWRDGEHRLHDRFVWRRATPNDQWNVTRLFP